jgi:ribosomal protein L11 methyltransferase
MSEQADGGELRWLEARVEVDGELAEAVSEYFGRIGTGGAVLEQIVPERNDAGETARFWVKAYLPVRSPEDDASHRRRVAEGVWHLSQIRPLPEPEFKLLADEDWAESWKAHYHPLVIGTRIVIKPSWCEWDASAGQIVVELDPGMAFGTGLHPSTQLCLIGLEDHAAPGQRVLDLGAGSGILSIAAARLGVGQVLALDIDPLSIESTTRNAAANGTAETIRVALGSLPPRDARDDHVAAQARDMAPAGFDLMLVNILAEVIADLLGRGLADWLAAGGVMITAGIIAERQELVRHALAVAGLEVIDRREQGDWVSLIARKPAAG